MKKISIITPCYNEIESIKDCCFAIKKLFNEDLQQYDYEHIICDNNSIDGTQKILREIAQKDKKVKLIFNSKNFGEEKNTFNGIKNSSGDAVVLYFPADQQDPPSLIKKFVHFWEKGYDLVYGVRKKRKEFILIKILRRIFYKIINIGSNNIIPDNISDYQLADKKVVDEIKKIEDFSPFLRSMAFLITDNYKQVEYSMVKRKHGKTKFSIFALIDYALNGLLNVSYTPFRMILVLGFVVSFISLLYGSYVFLEFLFFKEEIIKGIPLLIVSLFFFSGIQILLIGIIGEYLVSIHKQVKRRETLIEKEKINF